MCRRFPSLYNLEYDTFGNRTKTSVGTQLLSENIYRQGNGKLSGMAYGNGTETSFSYDSLGRASRTLTLGSTTADGFRNGSKTEYTYNAFGALSKTEESEAAEYEGDLYSSLLLTKYFTYDTIGRPISYKAVRGDGLAISAFYGYDSCSRLNKTSYSYGTTASYNQNYTYEYDNDNRVTKVTLPTSATSNNTYDELGRLEVKELKAANGTRIGKQHFSYVSGDDSRYGSNAATTIVSGVVDEIGIQGSYSYDNAGNITRIMHSLTGPFEYYSYDSKSQLIRHDSEPLNKTFVYTYNFAGNITAIKEYAYTTDTSLAGKAYTQKTFAYTNSNWKDLLTSYNGTTLTYDSIGNPLSYRDGMTMTWESGRRLKRIDKSNSVISYYYDENGIRTQKIVGGVTTNFELDGAKIIYQKNGADGSVISFMYDESGSPIGMNYAGAAYYYVKNLQGDIVGIKTATGTTVVTYAYDAWGTEQ